MKRQWVVLWSLWAARLARQPTLPVRVSGGAVRGEVAADGSHARYLGVPYATHRGRFQESGPEPKWDRVFEAYEENSRCLQRFGGTGSWVTGSEDCLTLNIYTPLNVDEKLPVMVFIHGGGFRSGSGSPYVYGPEHLVRRGVVLVTVNYRLDVLGFLNLGIEQAPGNVGMKDQVRALRWVRRNIAAFGGDPGRVTISGESAGSDSVMYHILSPMSKGLFHQAILQSGSLCPWSFQREPLEIASALVRQLGHEADDPHEIYDIISRTSSVDLLKSRVPRKTGDVALSENVFVPSVEKEFPGSERFLAAAPYGLLTGGEFSKVPILMGSNSAEGYYFVARENATTISNFNFVDSLPRDLEFPSEKERSAVGERLKALYVGDRNVTRDTLPQLAKYEGDSGIVYPVVATADFLKRATGRPVFAYRFCHNGWMNVVKFLIRWFGHPGATHADELFYMFKLRITLPMYFLETDVTDKVSTLWANFVKYGNPTPETTPLLPVTWEPVDKRDEVLIIDNKLEMAPLWYDEDILYWKEVYSKYRRKT